MFGVPEDEAVQEADQSEVLQRISTVLDQFSLFNNTHTSRSRRTVGMSPTNTFLNHMDLSVLILGRTLRWK